MKKALFLLFVPFVAFAICSDCDTFRSSLLTRNQDITVEMQSIQSDFSLIIPWANNLRISLENEGSPYSYDAETIYTQAVIGQARSATALEMLSSNRVEILAFDCSCASSSGCECAGVLTNIYDRLLNIEVYAREISYGMETLLRDDLPAFKEAVENGFINVSNQLVDVVSSIDSIVTNRFPWRYNLISTQSSQYQSVGSNGGSQGAHSFRYFYNSSSSARYSIFDGVALLASYLPQIGGDLNNMMYDFSYRRFPVLTNTVGTLTRESTNFFSFFRGEIGVHGVLEDWTAQKGTYHDFLTNHYIQVVTGGTLSGNQSAKTNWFSRIETLLAALVFSDSETTNTVDVSVGTQEREQLVSSYETANQTASVYSDNFKSTSQGIVALYRSYFNMFDNAALPSHVVLMSLSNIDSSGDVEISFQSDSLGVLVNACRVVTTFCWASVGIFMLYKFFVWASRCVIAACTFIYRAISSVFKS